MKRFSFKWTLCLLFLPFGTVYAQNIQEKANDFFKELYNSKQFNGNVLIAQQGQIVYTKNWGFAELDKKVPLTDDSKFPIASVSKPFTATAVLQLRQKGKLQLDDAVQKYLPDFPYQEITIRHLLSNTSGLAQYYNLFDTIMVQYPDKRISNNDIIPAFIQYKTKLSFKPGERWEYNNVNFCLAALIVERISELSFADYMQRYIFKPAHMKNTLVPKDRKILQEKQVERYSYPNLYTTLLENTRHLPESFKIEGRSNFYGNGGIVSTAEDLYKFSNALYDGTLLGQKELTDAFTPAILNNGKTVSYNLDEKEVSYGLGWEIYMDESNGKIVFHDGSITGLTSMLARNITKNQTIILLDNTGTNAVFFTSNAMIALLNQQPYVPVTQNFARQYGNLLVTKGREEADLLLSVYQKTPGKYRVTERDMIRMGYELIKNKKLQPALTVFKTATLILPNNWNAFDSYAEALLLNDNKEEAIKMYQKSIDLNPGNENGKKILSQLTK